jgi:hypothetical protein
VDELNQKNSNPFNSWGKRKKRRTQRVIKGFDEKKDMIDRGISESIDDGWVN